MSGITVLHISSPLTWRGGEQQIAYLYDELESQVTKQYILTPAGSALSDHGNKSGWNILNYRKRGGVDIGLARKIREIEKTIKPDIIHCHDSHAHTGAVIAASMFGMSLPIVVSRRVDFPIGNKWMSRWKYNHRSIARILCVSDEIARIVRPSIKNELIIVETVHSGIDLKGQVPGVPGKLRNLLNIPDDIKIIANVAALADHKDYFTFLDTAKLLGDREDIRFVILGDGPMREEIEKYAETRQCDNVIFAGFRNDLHELWGDMNVFLFTSKTEGLGTSVLDALAHRIPVVCTNAGGIPEIIENNVSGYMANVGDSRALAEGVLKVLDDTGYRNSIIEGGHIKVQSFSKSETAKKTLEAYRKVLNENA